MLAIVGLAATLLTGCVGKYTGGGFIDSIAGGNQKATFGFNFDLIDEDGDGSWDFGPGKVQFQFNDRSAGVTFHTTSEFGVVLVDDSFTEVLALGFEGQYTSQAGDGSVLVFVTASATAFDRPDTPFESSCSTVLTPVMRISV